MQRIRRLIALACLLPLPAAADYRVDIIVTLNRAAAPDVAQTHGRKAGPLVLQGAIDMDDRQGLQRAGIRLLPDKLFGLDDEWRKLRDSGLQPVYRASWQLEPRPTATAVRFHDNLRYQVHSTIDLATQRPVGTAVFEKYRLDGALLVQQSAGLRVTLDLDYTLPVNAPPVDYPASQATIVVTPAELATLSLQTEKRVNRGQVHYFDHPLLGVLLKVSVAE